MRIRCFVLLIICLSAISSFGQGEEKIPCFATFPSAQAYVYLPPDSLGYWYIPKRDTTVMVYFSDDRETYKHFNRYTMQVLVEGSFGGKIYTDSHMRFDKWSEYFETGIVKTTGYYYEDQPIGLWQFFYPNGQLQESYSISLIEAEPSSSYCRTGSYQSYYPNGILKVNGYYRASVDSTTEERTNYMNGNSYMVQTRKPIAKQFGIWTYYNELGQIERQEEFEEDINPFMWYDQKDRN